jgi:hypothetical protein
VAAGDHLGVECELLRRAVRRAGGIGRAQREAVDVGAIKRRHVDRRGKVARQHAAERCGERHALAGQGREIEMAVESLARLLGGDDFEKLLLPCRLPDGSQQFVFGARRLRFTAHGHGLTITRAPGAWPSLSAGTRIQPSAWASACIDR